MKKIIALSLVALLLLSLCSCGGKPGKTSDAIYQIGTNALATADEYIGGKITGDEAENKLKEYEKQASAQYEKGKAEDYEHDWDIYFAVSMLEDAIFNSNRIVNTGPMSEVKEARDALAKELGK
ncbi:hypothetical protein [uncultured Ruminococcus sp.]|uniref:hypothetical protein n=1 Tax=uncultured Ruminococcus sp. TaxID=165186 RepID=UPI0025F311F0|nr:hypothetical protein [uncultured Ruminococcus sp.]